MAGQGDVGVRLAGGAGARVARTHGLARAGQAEIQLDLPREADAAQEACAVQILRHIAEYVVRSGRQVRPGETMAGPWSTLRFAAVPGAGEPGPGLAVQEMADIFGDPDRGYVPGANATIRIMLAQNDAVPRNRVPDDLTIVRPHCDEMAVVCRRLLDDAAGAHLVELERLEPDQGHARDSGWCIGYRDAGHDHEEPANLAVVHVKHAVEKYPAILQYLAMPVGTALNFGSEIVVVFLPGQSEGRADPGAPLSWTP